jgi:hypothetical protein
MEAFIYFILGAIVSLVGNVVANYYDVRISNYFESRRFRTAEGRRARAMREFARVEEYKTGKWDAHLYATSLIAQLLFAVTGAISSVIAYLGILLLLDIHKDSMVVLGTDIGVGLRWTQQAITLFFTVFFMWALWYSFKRLSLLRNRLDNFGKYKEEVIEKWGPIDPPVH